MGLGIVVLGCFGFQAPFPDPRSGAENVGLEMAVFVGRPVPTPPHLDSKKRGVLGYFGFQAPFPDPRSRAENLGLEMAVCVGKPVSPPFHLGFKNGVES